MAQTFQSHSEALSARTSGPGLNVELPMPSSPRTIRLMQQPSPGGVGLFAITHRQQSTTYVFKEVRCDIGGRGFAVHRLGLGTLYHVRIGRPRDCSCDCLGFLRHGRCKHVLGLSALLGHGLI